MFAMLTHFKTLGHTAYLKYFVRQVLKSMEIIVTNVETSANEELFDFLR
jgi:hypothetical protein